MKLICFSNCFSLKQFGEPFTFRNYVCDELMNILISCVGRLVIDFSGLVLFKGRLGFDDELGGRCGVFRVVGFDSFQDVHNGILLIIIPYFIPNQYMIYFKTHPNLYTLT